MIPVKVQSAVQRRNLRYSHHKSHFSHTYFTFIKQVLGANSGVIKTEQTKGGVSVSGWGCRGGGATDLHGWGC